MLLTKSFGRILPVALLTLLFCCTNSAADRPAWNDSRLQGTPEPPLPLTVQRVHPNLVLRSPITAMDLPGTNRRLVLLQNGQVHTFENRDDVESMDLALDINKANQTHIDEQFAAARDLTLHPDFKTNGYLYVVWSIRPHDVEGGSRVSRFEMSLPAANEFDADSPNSVPSIDPESRLDLLSYPSGDHIGASLNFGPDGLLYITTGDGSLPFPPDVNKAAQDISDLRGSVLRIDVDQTSEFADGATLPYRIPDDNPFVDVEGARGEIFAFGLRNGFRAAFDPATDELWVADVGWERCEMVHRIVPGGNHGWSLYEGPHPVDLEQTPGPGKVILPEVVFPRSESQSITGGVFVPADALRAADDVSLAGEYLCGCFMNGNVWSIDTHSKAKTGKPSVPRKIASTGLKIIDFFVSRKEASSEILLVDHSGGLYRLVSNESVDDYEAFPKRLSETGLFSDTKNLIPNPGVVAYRPASTMFRDGIRTVRFVGIPGREPINPMRKRYVPGTVFANTLIRDILDASGDSKEIRLETQVLSYDGLNWNPTTFAWNEDQTDATLVPAMGATQTFRVDDPIWGQRDWEHRFYPRAVCVTCHNVANPGSASLVPENLRDESGPGSWSELAQAGFLVQAKVKAGHEMVNAYDRDEPLEQRARSYLHSNCAHCHRPAGGATSKMDLRHIRPLDQTALLGVPAAQGDFGLGANTKVIEPGHPERSALVYRVATGGPGKMPRVGCSAVDLAGAKMLWDWVESMPVDSDQTKASAEKSNETLQTMLLWRELVQASPEQSKTIVSEMLIEESVSQSPVVLGLMQPWIDPGQRKLLVGDNPDVDALLALEGNAQRGLQWFYESAASQCRQCHRIGGLGKDVGPSLAGIGKRRTRLEVLRGIFEPSEKIEPEWRSHTILTVDGELIVGRILREDGEAVVVQHADGTKTTLHSEDIELKKPNEQSLMPAGLLSAMTPQEVADLLEFLIQTNEAGELPASN
ncbi:PQQ-dependent sugar dehydrogenase [Rhodopirellula europaea]|jgi:putative heme-binding domain-containing protein|uniref:Glucose/sorbosone dehydrogenase n=1 Tax=Rhodopirellula europaea SH398 TaxID=1263868 RepID=M5RZB4_9BACT|nr:PQQ-dependent sugar dehydrogenase [Rhodopirellula europaea]EMI24640.1 glucose/sorbosone dehydrogenase [Rhodopirellula europaea SH398]